jgi:Leucine-rich repeat (LRR) protein
MKSSTTVRRVRRSVIPGSGIKLLLGVLLLYGPSILPAEDIVAVTRSGRSILVSQVEPDVRQLTLALHDIDASLDDPIVDIRGFGALEELADLHIYHAPQIETFEFLADASRLEVLVISFSRVRTIDFLSSMPALRVLVLEFCNDWESDPGLPFLSDPVDLVSNPRIEYIGLVLCALESMPRFVSVPESLRYLDLSYNSIDLVGDDPAHLKELRTLESIFLNGNPVDPTSARSLPNITLSSADDFRHRYLEWSP